MNRCEDRLECSRPSGRDGKCSVPCTRWRCGRFDERRCETVSRPKHLWSSGKNGAISNKCAERLVAKDCTRSARDAWFADSPAQRVVAIVCSSVELRKLLRNLLSLSLSRAVQRNVNKFNKLITGLFKTIKHELISWFPKCTIHLGPMMGRMIGHPQQTLWSRGTLSSPKELCSTESVREAEFKLFGETLNFPDFKFSKNFKLCKHLTVKRVLRGFLKRLSQTRSNLHLAESFDLKSRNCEELKKSTYLSWWWSQRDPHRALASPWWSGSNPDARTSRAFGWRRWSWRADRAGWSPSVSCDCDAMDTPPAPRRWSYPWSAAWWPPATCRWCGSPSRRCRSRPCRSACRCGRCCWTGRSPAGCMAECSPDLAGSAGRSTWRSRCWCSDGGERTSEMMSYLHPWWLDYT